MKLLEVQKTFYNPPLKKKGYYHLGEKHYGFFHPKKEVFAAFEKTVSITRLLKSKIIVFQTPAIFKPQNKNIKNMKEFFQSVTKKFMYV